MIKVGTFYDDFTNMDYDLYQTNAIELKNKIIKDYNLKPLKISMFNFSTQLIQDINTEIKNGNIKLDLNTGEIIEIAKEIKNGYTYRIKQIISANDDHSKHDNDKNHYHHIGYEIAPIVISVKDRNINNDFELIDGFKRIFWTYDIPDKNIFVKVYDKMDTKQWVNAMLLYNSWKILNSKSTFADRGFKLGLYKHFNLDLTTFDKDISDMFDIYISSNPYEVLKDNNLFMEDFLLIIDAYNFYMQYYNKHDKYLSHIGLFQFVERFSKLISKLRTAEFKEDRRNKALKITTEQFITFLTSEKMDKHIEKISNMKVPGMIDNYMEKHTDIIVINFFRALADLKNIKQEDLTQFKTFNGLRTLENIFKI